MKVYIVVQVSGSFIMSGNGIKIYKSKSVAIKRRDILNRDIQASKFKYVVLESGDWTKISD
ncbi:hypothetical protein HB904_04065 [Listeria booriae]|uniref:Uncharacterized protein n=1 Tax=Listeria booriae TaxID=1552123 RepID=A0A842AGZ8_9LIST|nr:hypothetical protein [Listeria booriae]MBC1615348.1 hypothetical protein [Listeria booriae]